MKDLIHTTGTFTETLHLNCRLWHCVLERDPNSKHIWALLSIITNVNSFVYSIRSQNRPAQLNRHGTFCLLQKEWDSFFFFSITHTHKSPDLHCKTGVQEQEPVPLGLQQEKRVKQAWQRKKTAQVHEELLPAGRNYMFPPIKRMMGFMEKLCSQWRKKEKTYCVKMYFHKSVRTEAGRTCWYMQFPAWFLTDWDIMMCYAAFTKYVDEFK